MNIPKYIDEALKKRTRAAMMFLSNDLIVSNWIEKHGLAGDIDTCDFFGGVEALVNPYESEQRIRSAISQKED